MKDQFFFNIFLVFTFVTVISGDTILLNNTLEEKIMTILKKWQEGGVSTELFSLPPLKSIGINKIQESYYEERGIKIIFSIGEMKLKGLNNFSVETLDIKQTQKKLNISAKILVPTLTLHSDTYKLAGLAYYFYSLKGEGAITIVSRNNMISINVLFNNINDIYTTLGDFSLNYSISNIEGNLENSSWPINEVINSEGVKILKSHRDKINELLRDYVMPTANEYLSHVTFKDFLNIIANINVTS